MTETPYKRTKLPFYMISGVVLLAVTWSGLWYSAAGHAEERLAKLIEKQGSKGTHIECENRENGGFPFRYELKCSKLSISSGAFPAKVDASSVAGTEGPRSETQQNIESSNAQGARTLTLENVHAVTQVFTPNHWIVEATGKATLREGDILLIDANAELYQASLRAVQDGVNISITGKNVNEDVWNLPTLSMIELHSRPVEGKDGELELAITGYGVHKGLFNPKAPFEFSALMQGQFSSVLNSNFKRDDFEVWAKTNGKVDVKQLNLRYDEFIANSSGVLNVSEAGRLTGTLNTHVKEQEKSTLEEAQGASRKKNLLSSPYALILMTFGINKLPADTRIILTEDSSQVGMLNLPALPRMW